METVAPPKPMAPTYGKTIGHQIAMHAESCRAKYGAYPVRSQVVLCGLWMPVAFLAEGHAENDVIIPFPDTVEETLRRRALNRADDRDRFKFYRIANHTKALTARINASRKSQKPPTPKRQSARGGR